MGYYWPKVMTEAIAYAKKCHAFQIHGDFVHQPPDQLHPTDSKWPFEMWGMDIMGPISPPSAREHRFILAITGYFSKWAEAIPLKKSRLQISSSSSSTTLFIASASLDGSYTTMGRSLSDIPSNGFALNLGYKAYPLQYITRRPMVLPRPSTKPSVNCSRNSSPVPNVIGTRCLMSAYGH